MSALSLATQTLREVQTLEITGTVAAVRGMSVLVDDLPLPVGSVVRLISPSTHQRSASDDVRGEVVGFDGDHAIVMLFGSTTGISAGTQVVGEQSSQSVMVGDGLLGRVINGLGEVIDGRRRPIGLTMRSVMATPTSALKRRRITEPLPCGVRAIDAMLTLGKGQRVGVFSGPGVGKSTLVATIARNTAADVNVIGLIGERGREVRDFIEHALGDDGLKRSVVVVATGDESPLMRVRAAMVTCAVAEHFRDAGADVMLMMDSITRFAQAQRQIGLTAGEQPATKGYTPSVFSMLPVILERAGAIEGGGSITGLYAVLVEGDDLTEPVSDAARGILDGHIALSRKLAARGHYPAIDLLESISRLADAVCDEHHMAARRLLLKLIAAHAEAEELINIGAYARGSNHITDAAVALKNAIDAFLQQGTMDRAEYPRTCRSLIELAAAAQQELAQRAAKAQHGARSAVVGAKPQAASSKAEG